MPIKIQSDLPVKEILEKENIFVMDENRKNPPTNKAGISSQAESNSQPFLDATINATNDANIPIKETILSTLSTLHIFRFSDISDSIF